MAELDSLGNVVSRFVYATRVNVPDYIVKADSTYRLILDHLGSVRLVVNVATDSVVQRLDYDEFGLVTLNTNPGFQPFGYAGGLHDEQTGLVRFGVRDYDASEGRWVAKDPSRFAATTNLYAYADNDPLNLVDVTGLRPITAAEARFLQSYFGSSLDVTVIDVNGPPVCLGSPCSPWGNQIRLPRWMFRNGDPACEVNLADPYIASLFAHEAAHVWQRQHGEWVSRKGLLIQLSARLGGPDPYQYRLSTDAPIVLSVFLRSNVEQQGQIVQDIVYGDMTGNPVVSQEARVRTYLRER